jgi:flagellar protein FliO/FliZ
MSGSFGSFVPMLVGALVVVLIAAGGAIFLVRRFGAGGGREGMARGRPSRLAMVDSTPIIDGRKLVIVRRDNVEHLLLIGGATDVLVEGNIARASAHAGAPLLGDVPAGAAAPEPPARVAAPEPVTRTPEPHSLPLAEGAKWPLAPEPVQRSKRPSEDGARWPLQPHSEPAAHSAEPRATEPAPSPLRSAEPAPPPMRAVEPEPAAAKQPAPVADDAKAKEDVAAPTDHFAELAAALQRPTGSESKPPSPMRPSAPVGSAADSNLTDMAHRLEAALRRPLSAAGTTAPPRLEPRRPPPSFAATPSPPRTSPTVDLPRMPPRLTPEPRQASEPAPGGEPHVTPDLRIAPEPRLTPEPRLAAEPRPASEPKPEGSPTDTPAFESLEREMASLLGRPPR